MAPMFGSYLNEVRILIYVQVIEKTKILQLGYHFSDPYSNRVPNKYRSYNHRKINTFGHPL
jgi:hypothetical protein